MQLKTLATNLIKFNCIAKLLAVGIAVSIGVPALAEVSQTTVKPFNPYYIQGGTEDNNGTILYICSTIVDGEYTPGKYYPPTQKCYVPWGGEEYAYEYAIFYTANSWTWVNFPGYILDNVRGGTEDNGANILYFCRAIVDGEYTPGKYYPPNQTCYVSWGGEEYGFKSNFQVLIAN